jgi:hypothetical protein
MEIYLFFHIHDRGMLLNITLWEEFALQFMNYNKERTDWGPTIILIHNGKINLPTGNINA